jgi:hypothetical protein
MGSAYIAYALERPLQYRLMFGTPLPDPQKHPEMMRSARHAFSLLQDGLARLFKALRAPTTQTGVDLDALFVWSSMHGLASLLQTRAIENLALAPAILAATPSHLIARIGAALTAPMRQTERLAPTESP